MMKSKCILLMLSSVGLLCPTFLIAQNLDDFFQVAAYTLIGTSEDNLGYQDTIRLENAPYAGANGVYSNGIYGGGVNPDYCFISTPHMMALYDSSFAIQLEFRPELEGTMIRPVLVCGASHRYLGLIIRHDSMFYVMINNGITFPTGVMAQNDQWYEVALIYNQTTQNLQAYLDGNLVYDDIQMLDRPDLDGNISNTNGGTGQTYKGYWRNLRVYSGEDITSTKDFTSGNSSLFTVTPNPASQKIHLRTGKAVNGAWSLLDLSGKIWASCSLTGTVTAIDVSGLSPGSYVLRIEDEYHQMIESTQVIIFR